jgi:hypothetical protein
MSADVIMFIPKANLERDALIQTARANDESVFPTSRSISADELLMDHADTGDLGMPSDSAYCAPDSDPA